MITCGTHLCLWHANTLQTTVTHQPIENLSCPKNRLLATGSNEAHIKLAAKNIAWNIALGLLTPGSWKAKVLRYFIGEWWGNSWETPRCTCWCVDTVFCYTADRAVVAYDLWHKNFQGKKCVHTAGSAVTCTKFVQINICIVSMRCVVSQYPSAAVYAFLGC